MKMSILIPRKCLLGRALSYFEESDSQSFSSLRRALGTAQFYRFLKIINDEQISPFFRIVGTYNGSSKRFVKTLSISGEYTISSSENFIKLQVDSQKEVQELCY